MWEIDQETAPPPTAAIPNKKHLSFAMTRISDWILSQEIPTDIAVHVGEATFSLHKFPLVSKCGFMRRLVSQPNGSNLTLIEMPDIPGGAGAFDFVAKFCYGTHIEISTDNVAMLRCAAEYLEMTEDYAVGNLVSKTEAYIEEVVLMSLSDAVAVLHYSEHLLPMAEKVKLVTRCIEAVAYIATNDSQLNSQNKGIVHWWADDLTTLRIGTFQRLIMAMNARGFSQLALGPVLMLYAQKSLRGLIPPRGGKKKIEPKQEHEKRVVLETIVGLLPTERNTMSVSFLSMLLRTAMYLETTVACRLELEQRMGLQLEQAVLDDLLIPIFSFNCDTMYDVDSVQAILMNYLDQEIDGIRDDDYVLERIGRLMESYLVQMATDPNLAISSFASIAEMIPERAKVSEDGMYRAIDIYLKAHPTLSDIERKKVCSLMDFEKLSREACAHAAQNERLPVQVVVEVLHHEQHRLRDAMEGGFVGGESPGYHRGSDKLSSLQRENDDMKVELVRMKMELKETENPLPPPLPPLPKNSFVRSVSKKLGRLYPFLRSDMIKPLSGKARVKPARDRRHSVS